jgi:CPA2 family monovalent cation:H+ antiporter-2
MLSATSSSHAALVFIELGAIVCGLAILARVSDRVGLSPIPLYLVAGLCFGEGGLVQPDFSTNFIRTGGEIGVILLLLALGLEYTPQELTRALRASPAAGFLDLALNATPGVAVGLLLGFDAKETLVLAGVTYISSSGIVAKVLTDLDRLGNRETPTILSLLVVEDLAMAVYLPITAVVLARGSALRIIGSEAVALAVLACVLVGALRYSAGISRLLAARTNEALLLGVVGVTLLVAGAAQWLNISAAVGAFLVGIALSGTVQRRASALIEPLRDLFAAMFFLFFALQVDPAKLVSTLPTAIVLAAVTALTKIAVGIWATRRNGIGPQGQMRAGTALVARGEFSIVIAGLATAAGASGRLASLAAGYVLLLATFGPLLARDADRLAGLAARMRGRPNPAADEP